MMTTIWSASLTIQDGNAISRPVTTPNPNPQANQDLQAAARELRDAIRNNIRQEIGAARSQAAAQATTPEPPAPPGTPRVITIRGANGTQTITLPPHPFDNTIPPQAVDISIAFFLTVAAIIIGLPLARAFARRMDRRAGAPQIPSEVSSQLAHLNQAVDAIALEVERISEGQRFTTRLLSEQRDAARQTLAAGTDR
jgi:hypothetical protein